MKHVVIEKDLLNQLIEAAQIRRDQWQAVVDGGLHSVVDELYEADAEEGADMVSIFDKAIAKAEEVQDRGVYFLPTPTSPDFIEVATSQELPDGDPDIPTDEHGDPLPKGSVILYPH